MAYIGGDSAHPDELFASAIDGRGEKKLTSFNDAFVKDVERDRGGPDPLPEQGRHAESKGGC